MAACLPVKLHNNPEKANTTNAQYFPMKARDGNDLSGHPLNSVVKLQSPGK